MSITSLLPPPSAVRMVWALTGAFSNDQHSNQSAILVEAALKDIKDRAEADEKENQYVISAIATMDASRRSLDTIYKGRQLNFEENGKLRSVYLDSVRDSFDFGSKAKDFLKSLPTMTIGTAGGMTIAQALGLSGSVLWAVGLILAAAGYLVNLWFVRRARRQTQLLYIAQDYERGLYYDQYVSRVAVILTSLYLDINRIHKNVFGTPYPTDGVAASQIIEDMLHGVRPTYCQYVHKHMREKKVTPELWSLCETGSAGAVQKCPHWEGQSRQE
ncbi:MAG: hypothetical protein ACE5H9_17250 [Anaerolineae bacterium]